ncbi:YncE family protein [Emticicia sp. 17c]|uniref:YncE family protein n=1 Tax=Emticicia sp. 17c TaxID=3127704 RepID=UPI00301C1246
MKFVSMRILPFLLVLLLLAGWKPAVENVQPTPKVKRYLYVATPGVRDYLGYGGHGIQVFDIDNKHQFVKFIPTAGLHPDGKPSNVKGVCVSLATNCIYISTVEALQCIDLTTEKLVWEKQFEGGADRMSVSPDGKIIYLPSFEKEFWNVIDARTGNLIQKIVTNSGSHNTLYGLSGKYVYLAGLKSPYLTVTDAKTHTISKQVGPFNAEVRPFTINGAETLAYVNINGLLGFEVGDLKTGKKLHRVEVQGFNKGEVKRHGCPTHGIGLTPDEKELWICDGANNRLHVFDNTQIPPKQVTTITVKDMPGWITFSLDGKYAYPSTGDVIDVKTRKIIASLEDQNYNSVQSEKMIEIHFSGTKPIRAGDQFGIGRVLK